MFKVLYKENEVYKRLSDDEFDELIASYKQTNKEMREECIKILCENAYVCGKGSINIDLEKDAYEGYTDVEILRIRTSYLEGKIEKLEMESAK